MIEVGMVIGGRLRIDQVLGAGGMGLVASATHLELGHKVAVKVMRDELAQSSSIVERFIREARAVVQLRTEHVCRVLDVGRLDSGAPYIMMELLEGADLARAIAQRPLPVPIAVEYIVQACVGLAEAHSLGMVHRDLKPANLFVTRRADGGPLVKVLDFGIAKAMNQGAALTGSHLLGSPGFMSPEQIQSAHDVDARSDIWALGVTLYQLVCGRLPFFATNPMDVAIKIASEPPLPLTEVDPALAAVIMRCIEKDPARRYQDVRALVADLARFGGQAAMRASSSLITPQQVYTPPPNVAMSAATAPGTSVNVTTAPPRQRTEAPAPPPSRAWIWIVAVVGLVFAGGITALVLTRGSPTATAQAPAPAVDDAAVARDAAAVVAVAADAATPVDAAPPPPPPAPNPMSMLPPDVQKKAADAMLKNAQLMDQAHQKCQKTVDDPKKLKSSPYEYVYCACYVGDAAKARESFPKVPDTVKKGVAQLCSMYGVQLQ